ASPSCSDRLVNGNETDVDCGGGLPCLPCEDGRRCFTANDCLSNYCINNLCAEPPRCDDGLRNGDESDVDCGGSQCAGCATARLCRGGADCIDHVCKNNRCAAPSCSDGVQNGYESDVDCGDGCLPCPIGKHCSADYQCAWPSSGRCAGAVCVAA